MSDQEVFNDEGFQQYMQDCQSVDTRIVQNSFKTQNFKINEDSKILENINSNDEIQSENLNKDDNQQNNVALNSIEQNNNENMGKNTQNNQTIGKQKQNNEQNNFKEQYKYIIDDNKTSEEIFNYGLQLAIECEQILKTISSH